MRDGSWFEDLVTAAGGVSLVTGVASWLLAFLWRHGFRRPVSFGEWFTHGVASGALIGGVAWALGLLP